MGQIFRNSHDIRNPGDAPGNLPAGQTVQPGEKIQIFPDSHVIVNGVVGGQIADGGLGPAGMPLDVISVDGDAAAAAGGIAGENVGNRALAAARPPQHAGNLPVRNGKGNVVDCDGRAEILIEHFGFDHALFLPSGGLLRPL